MATAAGGPPARFGPRPPEGGGPAGAHGPDGTGGPRGPRGFDGPGAARGPAETDRPGGTYGPKGTEGPGETRGPQGTDRPATAKPRTTTVGVAIPVPPPWGERLDRARADSGDPLGGSVPAHLTLLGPTEIPAASLDAFRAHLAAVARACPPFDLHLRGTGSFRPVTEVVFVAVVDGIAVCEQLESAIRSGPAERERTFPYHPHVTVAQNVGTAALDAAFDDLAAFEAKFRVDSFTLYTHPNPGQWSFETLAGAPIPWTPRAVFPLGA